MKFLAEREFEAMKERVGGKRKGFGRVACINATVALSVLASFSVSVEELCSTCKFSEGGEDRVVVGSLDLNQCASLPDEIAGTRPKEIGADFARAYLSNACVDKELHRNGLAHALVAKSKLVAHDWGISDLYVHVAVDNEPAKKLYRVDLFSRVMNLHGRPDSWTGQDGYFCGMISPACNSDYSKVLYDSFISDSHCSENVQNISQT